MLDDFTPCHGRTERGWSVLSEARRLANWHAHAVEEVRLDVAGRGGGVRGGGCCYPELVARVRAVLRRVDPRASRETIRVGPLTIDRAMRSVTLHGELIEMSQKEFNLLWRLATDPTKVFTKEQLMRELWGSEHGSSRTLDSHVCRVRNKLRVQGDPFVTNVWGVGYRLLDGPARDVFAS